MRRSIYLLAAMSVCFFYAFAATSPLSAQEKSAKAVDGADKVQPGEKPNKAPSGEILASPLERDDSLEDLNRMTSSFNRSLREWVIDPVVDGYQAVTPDVVQTAVSNIFSNLTEPLTAVSSLLQGDPENAVTATSRFLINSTIGIGGIIDRATEADLVQRREDLGQAMGVHGVGPGPHIVLPLIGPSNLRDAAGDIAMFIVNPLPTAVTVTGGGVEYANKQEAIKSLTDDAVDPYIAERDSYEQNRQFVINNGQKSELPEIANLD